MFSSLQNFTVNGDDYKDLEKVLDLVFDLSESDVKAFYEDKNGLVFCAYKDDRNISYPFKPNNVVLAEQIKQYIDNLSYEDIVRLAGEEPDDDGDVLLGWELFHPLWYGKDYIELWDDDDIIAVRPCWIVYGK